MGSRRHEPDVYKTTDEASVRSGGNKTRRLSRSVEPFGLWFGNELKVFSGSSLLFSVERERCFIAPRRRIGSSLSPTFRAPLTVVENGSIQELLH